MSGDTRQNIVVLVNGGEGSAGGVRARGLFEPLSDRYQVDYFFRDGSKLGSLRRFFRQTSALRPNLVYVIDTAISGAGAASLARMLRNRPFLIDTGDLGYELAESTGTPGWAGRKIIGLVEAMALRLASGVVVRGTFHKEILEKAGFRNVHLIRDGIHVEQSRPLDVSGLRRELGLDGHLCVGMMGSIRWNRRYQMCYGWDLIEALGLLEPSLPVCGLIIGDGDGLPVLQKRTAELGLNDRVRFVGRVPYSEVPQYTNLMDVALSTQTNNRVGQVRTTGKLPEYMAAGCYILATDVGEARLLLPDEMRLPYAGVRDDAYPLRLAAKITALAEMDRRQLERTTAGTTARANQELTYSFLSPLAEQAIASVFS
jgi:glycosyltransferase involved in cell wall biosynthesis